jgi:hypothetical protein
MSCWRSLFLVLVALLPAMPLAALAQQQVPVDNSHYIIFIHSGGRPDTDPLVQGVLRALLSKGYSVRKPDNQRDEVGGPGVDYFADEEAGKAQEVADIVNTALNLPTRLLQARRQRVKNPPGYLGVWLF